MKGIPVILIATLCAAYTACATEGTEELSLEGAIALALENSLNAELAEIEIRRGDVALAEGVGGIIPDMSLYTTKSSDSITGLSPGDGDYEIGFKLSVDTGTFLSDYKSSAAEKKYYRAGAFCTRAELVLNVEKTYYNFAQSGSLLDSANARYERAAKNYDVVSRRYELGDSNKVELLRAEANLLSAEKEVLSAEAALTGANRELCDIIGDDEWRAYSPQTIPDPKGTFDDTPDSDEGNGSGVNPDKYDLKSNDDESQYGGGVKLSDMLPGPLRMITGGRGHRPAPGQFDNNPEIQELKYKVEMYKLDYRSAWTSMIPKTTFSIATGAAGLSSAFPSDESGGTTEYQVMISYDIANLKNAVLGINRSRLEKDKAELDIKLKKQEINRKIADMADSLDTAYLSWGTARKNVELSEEAYRLATRGYELGIHSLTDLLEIESELYEAECELAKTKTEYWSAGVELDYILGYSMEGR